MDAHAAEQRRGQRAPPRASNTHTLELVSAREALWTARVEPVSWYSNTFTGIVQGSLPNERALQIAIDGRKQVGELIEYRFKIHW